MAQILGFSSYADLSLSKKMAPDVDSVLHLIDMLLVQSKQAAEQELLDLKKYIKESSSGTFPVEELSLWDIPYYSERLREHSYQYEEESLRPYFALPNVLNGLFSLANRLFGITIEEAAPGETQVWHPDVKFFNIKDTQTGE